MCDDVDWGTVEAPRESPASTVVRVAIVLALLAAFGYACYVLATLPAH